MRVVRLEDPYPNGFEKEDDPVALKYLKDMKTVYTALMDGKLFCRFVDGDRAGSIARLVKDPDCTYEEPSIRRTWSSNRWGGEYRFERDYFSAICKWDGRKNKVKQFLPHCEVELLLNYNGPTVWEKFDAKTAKEEALKNPDQRDIDDNVLNVGDRVLYINARYGARMVLSHGVIKEFKAVADSRGTTITTVVEGEDGQLSEMLYPESMIYLMLFSVSQEFLRRIEAKYGL